MFDLLGFSDVAGDQACWETTLDVFIMTPGGPWLQPFSKREGAAIGMAQPAAKPAAATVLIPCEDGEDDVNVEQTKAVA